MDLCTVFCHVVLLSVVCVYGLPVTTTGPPPTTTTVPSPRGYCLYQGQYYQPGTMIHSGQSGNWCYYTYCDMDGNVLMADDFNCSTTTTTERTTIPQRTTTPPQIQ